MELQSIIIAVGTIQGIILSITLFRHRKLKGYSNILLALFCLLFSLLTLDDFLMKTKLILQVPHLFAVFYPFIFALAPVFFLYVKSLTDPSFKLKSIYIIHFLPFLLFLILLSFTIYFHNRQIKIQWINESINETGFNFFNGLTIIQCLAYILASLELLNRHTRNIRKVFSYNEKINLNWLKWLTLGVIILWGVWGLSNFLRNTFFQNLDAFAFPIFVYVLGYWGINQKMVYTRAESSSSQEAINSEKKIKYSGSEIPTDIAEEKLDILVKYMEREKPFLDGELTIQTLSQGVGIPVNHLSQIINGQLNQNFFEFINAYRIEEFKKNVLSPDKQHLSMLGIALDCGFNSKASFNAVFKKTTGLTPSEYKKQSQLAFKESELRL